MRVILFHILFITTCSLALWRGGRDEKRMAVIIILGILGSIAAVWLTGPHERWHGLQPGLALVDLAVLVAFTHLALTSDHHWPMGMAGLQLAAVGGHVLKAIEPDMPAWQYWLSSAIWSWPMTVLLLFATLRSWKARATF